MMQTADFESIVLPFPLSRDNLSGIQSHRVKTFSLIGMNNARVSSVYG